jgi:hypothetical protein
MTARRGQEEAEDPTDSLFSTPLAEFVTTRDQLARELKKAGRAEEAATVKAIPKPTPSAWALNQTARKSPDAMARFLTASDALERAQTGGGRAAYQDALAEQRKSLEALLAVTGQALGEAGVKATRTVLERMANDLRWGALDPATRSLLQAGRLLRDVTAPDFSALVERMGGEGSRAKAPPRPAPKPAPARHDAAHAAAARRNEERLAAARADRDRAHATLTEARGEEADATKALSRARAALTAARDELRKREREEAEAARAHAAAEKAVAHAEKLEERMSAALDRAEKDTG